MRAAHLPIQAESPPRRSGAGVGTPAGMSDVPRRVAAPLPAARSSLASDRTVADYFDVNLAALAGRSPSVVEAVRSARAGQAVRTLQAASGAPILERDGGVLESRRDPVAAADRIAEGVGSDAVVVAGFGTGYLAEALRRRGVTVVAVVDAGPANLAAAMSVRDLRRLLGEIPVVLLDDLVDAVDLAVLWARTACLVPHGPSVTSSPSLGALVAEWPSVRVASRPPRLLVAGPLYGGSLEIARAVARAAAACGAEVQLFDAAAYAGAHAALGELRVGSRRTLQARLVALAGDAIADRVLPLCSRRPVPSPLLPGRDRAGRRRGARRACTGGGSSPAARRGANPQRPLHVEWASGVPHRLARQGQPRRGHSTRVGPHVGGDAAGPGGCTGAPDRSAPLWARRFRISGGGPRAAGACCTDGPPPWRARFRPRQPRSVRRSARKFSAG